MRISDWSSDVCSSDLLDPRFPRTVDHQLRDILRFQKREERREIVAQDGGIAHDLPPQFQIVDIGKVEILGDENADLLALVLLQHRPDIDIVLQGDRSAFAGRPRHIVEIAIAARGGLPSDIGGIIDEREEQSAAKARPEKRSEEHTSELQSLMRISYAVFCC